jgi:hypothetical protein
MNAASCGMRGEIQTNPQSRASVRCFLLLVFRQKKARLVCPDAPFLSPDYLSDNRYVHRCGPFGTLLDVEGDFVTFLQGFKSRSIDTGVMNEYIRPFLLLNKAVSFALIEPFDNTICHRGALLKQKFSWSHTSGGRNDKWVYPSE